MKVACGAIFISVNTGRVLLSLRAPHKTYKNNWSLWGGMLNSGETPKECLLRELEEEIGFLPDVEKIYPYDVYQSEDGNFRYYSFVCIVENEFIPILNHESSAYCWTNLGVWPSPMHIGARLTLCDQDSLLKLKQILANHE